MTTKSESSRRDFFRVLSSIPLAGKLALAATQKEDKAALPIIPRRVEKAFMAPGQHPNDLETVVDGLWILDQAVLTKLIKCAGRTEKLLRRFKLSPCTAAA